MIAEKNNRIFIYLGGKKKKKKTAAEKAAMIAEIEKSEKVFDFRPKLNGCVFGYWLYIQTKKAENRYFEARMKNLEDWAQEGVRRKSQQIRQMQINWSAERKLQIV